MEELNASQQVRLECIITAHEHYNTLLENDIEPTRTPYQLADAMYEYVMAGKIPEINYN